MNHYFPEWNFEPDLPAATQRKPLIEEEELVELLWENGQVVLNNRTNKNQGVDQNESRKSSKSCNEPSTNILKRLGQENELVSWNHHCDQVDDPFEKELSSFILPEFIPVSSNSSSLIHDSPIESYKFSNFDGSQISHICANSSQPPQLQDENLGDIVCNNNISKRGLNNNNHSCPTSNGGGSMKMRANSGKTVGSSHCGSNQVIYDAEDDGFAGKFTSQSERSNERETITGSLSSGGSGFTTGNQSTGTNSSKRKCRETENSEFQSEDVLLESIPRKKTAQEFVGTRKSRASEVHNLSERRRRDRINEKMRALQELLPRSNQTDKASMLDEAIQYMKSLQLQLQMMWMGSQMAPMMFPTYMSRLELGISSPLMPNLQSAMNLTRLPLMDQARANQAAIINYQNQLQNCNFSDQYGAYIGFYPPVHSTNQQLNMYNNSYGLNMAQHNQTLAPPGDANIRPPA